MLSNYHMFRTSLCISIQCSYNLMESTTNIPVLQTVKRRLRDADFLTFVLLEVL